MAFFFYLLITPMPQIKFQVNLLHSSGKVVENKKANRQTMDNRLRLKLTRAKHQGANNVYIS